MFLSIRNLACAALVAVSAGSASASIVINVAGANLTTSGGTNVVAGTLLQLVNLGPNGVFDVIDVADGSGTGLARWTSGDDSVVNVVFQTTVGQTVVPGDFTSTKAFDLEFGVDSTPGLFSRTFQLEFGAIATGAKLGIRWFPGLAATDFDSITLAIGQSYGQFTRQSPDTLRANGTYWVMPGDGAQESFDSMLTQSFNGGTGDPDTVGRASLTVVPEPAAIGLSLLGAAGLAFMRRRRH
jgi:hypothetical protein